MNLDFDDVNIFFTHLNPTFAAEFCCDAHVRKMVVESTQMLANAYHMERANIAPPQKADGTPYAKSHWNHPSAIWVREDYKHWDWLRMHAYGLAKEFEYRFGNKHACLTALSYMTENNPLAWMEHKSFVCPPLAMPWEYRSRVASPIGCYRRYIREAKKHLHNWTKRAPPLWLFDDAKLLDQMARKVLDMADLSCFDADDYRGVIQEEFEPLTDDVWGDVIALACDIANGRDPEGSANLINMAESLFDKCRLELLGVAQFRHDAQKIALRDLTKAEWEVVVYLATEYANGNDPLTIPTDWDLSNYRG